MNYELVKSEFIKLKKEELDYIDNIAKISNIKILTEEEKLEIYRNLKNYEIKINEMYKSIFYEVSKNEHLTSENLKDVIIEFELDKDCLSSVNFRHEDYKKYVLENLGIDTETLKFKLTLNNLIRGRKYKGMDSDIIQNNQKLIEKPIYIFCGYYDSSEDCFGPRIGEYEDYLYGIYENICIKYNAKKEIPKKHIKEFERDKIIIHSQKYVRSFEITEIFEEELLNIKNKTLIECVNQTKNRIEKLNYTRSPEYKEKILLDKIEELYKKVKGEFIKQELLYSNDFIEVLKETYKLPDENIVEKEKVVRNDGKYFVVVIGITPNEEYIINFKNEVVAQFPSGYMERYEDTIEAATRHLKEQTGYSSEDLFVIDEAYTCTEFDSSVTYIVIANNCVKANEKIDETMNCGLFSKKELQYLINKNIINGSIDKLAYYNLINNTEECNIFSSNSGIKKYLKKKEKTNPLDNYN